MIIFKFMFDKNIYYKLVFTRWINEDNTTIIRLIIFWTCWPRIWNCNESIEMCVSECCHIKLIIGILWLKTKIYFISAIKMFYLFIFLSFKSAKHSRENPVSVSNRKIKIRVSFPVPVTLSSPVPPTHYHFHPKWYTLRIHTRVDNRAKRKLLKFYEQKYKMRKTKWFICVI